MGTFFIGMIQIGVDYYSLPSPLSGAYSLWLERTFWALKCKGILSYALFSGEYFHERRPPKKHFLNMVSIM